MESTEHLVLRIIQSHLGLTELPHLINTIEELNIDSLDIIEIVMEIEDQLSIDIDDNFIEEWKIVADITNQIINIVVNKNE